MTEAVDECSAGLPDTNIKQNTELETNERLCNPVLSSDELNISVSDLDSSNSNSYGDKKVVGMDSDNQLTNIKLDHGTDSISDTYGLSSYAEVTSVERGVDRLDLGDDVKHTEKGASVDSCEVICNVSRQSNEEINNDLSSNNHCDNSTVEMPSSVVSEGQTLCDRLNADLSDGDDDDDSDSIAGNDEGEEAFHSAEENDDVKVDEAYLQELEMTLSDEEKQKRQTEARSYKDEGNSSFKQGMYDDATTAYTRGLQLCPLAYEKDRSIMYSNRAACYMRQEKYEQAIGDSSKAINLHPHYVKAISRRGQLYEKTEKLDEALSDYQRVLELNPGDHIAREASMRLPEQITQRNEKLKDEMMGKLKELGNMVLKPFGLSTNNFQLQQDPNTGGYSVQFNQNGK